MARIPQSSQKKGQAKAESPEPSFPSPFSQTPPSPFTRTPLSPLSPGATITPRRLDDGHLTTSSLLPKKNIIVYLIRHGESKGQVAKTRAIRQTDPTLLDCRLTPTGRDQARALRTTLLNNIDWVVCSPLTRAMETAVLGFPSLDTPILCHYDLREIGSPIPENIPRRTQDVLADLQEYDTVKNIDVQSLRPAQWPYRHETPPKVVRRDRIRQVFAWLADTLPEHVREIAVVCHYHVIRTALSDPYDQAHAAYVHKSIHPVNAVPIRCELTPDGKLKLAPEEAVEESRSSPASSGSTNKQSTTKRGKIKTEKVENARTEPMEFEYSDR
jgi:broad specificity phosphatase PhoE